MKKMLVLAQNGLFHSIDGVIINGKNSSMRGNCTGLLGNCTGLSGNIDDCELTDDDRKIGIDIASLIFESAEGFIP